MTAEDPDRVLVERVQKGDKEAFDFIVRRYQRLLTSLAFGMLRDEGTTGDVVQEAFISAWKALPKFRGEARFRNWLCRILINKARSALRWGRLWGWVSLNAPTEQEKSLLWGLRDKTAEADPEDGMVRKERAEAVRNAVAALPLQQRTAVLLRGNGLDMAGIAETMGLAEGTVKAHLHQARVRLEKILEAR